MTKTIDEILRSIPEEDRGVVQHLLDQKTDAERSLRRFEEESSLLHGIARDFVSSLDFDTLISKISQDILAKLHYDAFTFALVEDVNINGGKVPHLKVKYHFNNEQTQEEINDVIQNYRIPLDHTGGGVGHNVVKTGNATYIADIDNDPRINRRLKTKGLGSYVTIPLLSSQGDIIGTISAGKKKKNGFNDDLEFKTIENIATYMSAALDNIRIKESSEKNLRKMGEKFKIMADHAYDLAFWQMSDGSFEYVSESSMDILGYSPREFYDKKVNLDNLVAEEDKPLFQRMYDGEHPNQRFNVRMQNRDGKHVTVSLVYKTIIPKDGPFKGQFQGIRGTITDVSKILGELLPMCCYCHSIRDDTGVETGHGKWREISSYISNMSGSRVSHGICPECYDKHISPGLEVIPRHTKKQPG